ncbi:MAG TPA: ABC transporter permease subunit [Candidatus Limnocylindrales bacterium]
MTGYREMVVKELFEAWRTRRLLIVVLLFLGLGISAPIVTKLLPDIIRAFGSTAFIVDLPTPGVADVLDQLLKNTVQFGALAAILLTMGSVATERERGTAAFVLSKPVTRTAFLWAKLVALGVQFAVAIGLAVAGAWLYTLVLFQRPAIMGWVELAGLVWLSTMVYVSITFLGSVVAKSALGAAGFGFLGLIVLSLLSIVPNFGPWLPADLSAVAKSFALHEQSPDLDPTTTILMSFGIAIVAVGLAWWRFRRAEL